MLHHPPPCLPRPLVPRLAHSDKSSSWSTPVAKVEQEELGAQTLHSQGATFQWCRLGGYQSQRRILSPTYSYRASLVQIPRKAMAQTGGTGATWCTRATPPCRGQGAHLVHKPRRLRKAEEFDDDRVLEGVRGLLDDLAASGEAHQPFLVVRRVPDPGWTGGKRSAGFSTLCVENPAPPAGRPTTPSRPPPPPAQFAARWLGSPPASAPSGRRCPAPGRATGPSA